MKKRISSRYRNSILQSLRAGVTPRTGLQYIQVGRSNEVQALLKDVECIKEGGTAIRFIIGDYGSGKSFFLQLVRSIALNQGLVTMHADLTPTRRLHATNGQARNLFNELIYNISTRTKQDGNALTSIVERFITQARAKAKETEQEVSHVIAEHLDLLNDLVGGYDFASVIQSYWEGHETGNEQLKSDAVRWLRGEFSTKTEAKKALGVRTIVDDSNIYNHIKLFSLFVQQAGYAGLLVCLDEMVNLYKLKSKIARENNYEQILAILNDCCQGDVKNLGFLFGGTPEFLSDTRKGLFSYEALRSRLAPNTFAQKLNLIDYNSPTLRLASLTPEELYLLLGNIRNVYASGDPEQYLVPDQALEAFRIHCLEKIGESYFRTPRTTIKAFVEFLSILEQHPDLEWQQLIKDIPVEVDAPSAMDDIVDETTTLPNDDEDDLSTLKL